MTQLLKALIKQGLPKPLNLPMTFINVVKIHLWREDKWNDELSAFVIDFIVQTLKHTIHKKILAVLLRYVSSFKSCVESLFRLWNIEVWKRILKKSFQSFFFQNFWMAYFERKSQQFNFLNNREILASLMQQNICISDMRENYAKISWIKVSYIRQL